MSRELKSERRNFPKLLEKPWLKLAERWTLVQELDDTLTRAHTREIKGVAVVDDYLFTGSWDSYGKLWHVEEAKLLKVMQGHRQDIIGVCGVKSRLGSTRFFSAADRVRCWDPLTGACVATFGSGTYYCVLATRSHVFCCHSSGAIEKYAFGEDLEAQAQMVQGQVVQEYTNATPVQKLQSHTGGCMGLDINEEENILVSASLDQMAKVWNLATGECVHTLRGHTNQLRDVVIWVEQPHAFLLKRTTGGVAGEGEEDSSGEGAGVGGQKRIHVFSAARDNTIQHWDAATGTHVRTLKGHTDAVRALVIVNSTIFSSSSDHTVRQWDANTGKELLKFSGHNGDVYGMCEAHGSLFTCAADRVAKRWDLGAGRDIVLVPSQEYRSAEAIELVWPVLSLLVIGVQVLSFALSERYPWPDIMLPVRIPAAFLVLSLDLFQIPPNALGAWFWLKWSVCLCLAIAFAALFVSDKPTEYSYLSDQGRVLLGSIGKEGSIDGEEQEFSLELLQRLGIDITKIDVAAVKAQFEENQRRLRADAEALAAAREQWLKDNPKELVVHVDANEHRVADARLAALRVSLGLLTDQIDSKKYKEWLEKRLVRIDRLKSASLVFMMVMSLIGLIPLITINATTFACAYDDAGTLVWTVDRGETECYAGWHLAGSIVSGLEMVVCLPMMILLVMSGGEYRNLPSARAGATTLEKLWAKFTGGLGSNAATIDIGIITRQPSTARTDELLTAMVRVCLVLTSLFAQSTALGMFHWAVAAANLTLLTAYLATLFFVQPFKAPQMNAFVFVSRLHLVWTALVGFAVVIIDDKTVWATGAVWYVGTLLWWIVGFRMGRFFMGRCKCGYEVSGALSSTKIWPLLGR